jgi:hypothetical protein
MKNMRLGHHFFENINAHVNKSDSEIAFFENVKTCDKNAPGKSQFLKMQKHVKCNFFFLVYGIFCVFSNYIFWVAFCSHHEEVTFLEYYFILKNIYSSVQMNNYIFWFAFLVFKSQKLHVQFRWYFSHCFHMLNCLIVYIDSSRFRACQS